MVSIDSTPEMAAKIYQTMAKNLAVVRRRLGKPLTWRTRSCSATSTTRSTRSWTRARAI